MVIAKFKNLNFWQIFGICNLDFLFMTWDLMWITSMGNHGAAGGNSERSLTYRGLVMPFGHIDLGQHCLR